MSTVYVLCRCYDYEGCTLVGVFSTRELAMAHADEIRPHTGAELEIDEVTVDALSPDSVGTANSTTVSKGSEGSDDR